MVIYMYIAPDNMTEKLFTGTLNKNQNKNKNIAQEQGQTIPWGQMFFSNSIIRSI